MTKISALAELDPWQVYLHQPSWPSAPDLRFIIDAVSDALWSRYEIPHVDVAEDDTTGYRNDVAIRFLRLILDGSLTLFGMRFEGGEPFALTELDLTPDAVQHAISTGWLERREERGRSPRLWAFVGRREADLLAAMLAVEAGTGDRDAMLDRLIGVATANLSAVSGNGRRLPDQGSAERVLALLLPSLRPALGDADRDRLVTAVVPWLERSFEADPQHRRTRDEFRDEAIRAFAPYMTKRIFERVWAKVVGSHPKRSTAGPRGAGAAS